MFDHSNTFFSLPPIPRSPAVARTLMGVWAHPDDEAYLAAGLMARWRRRGDRVVVVTATPGEHGTSDPVQWPPERLARLRSQELRNSLAVLGVDELHLLGFEDGSCQDVDGTDMIADLIADVRPDVIVTFGPDGMTGHPDHRAVSDWATDARALASPGSSLWYSTVTPEFHRLWGATNERLGLWADQPEPPCTELVDIEHHVRLTDELTDLKVAALREHASQTTPLLELLGPADYREWWRSESFRNADRAKAGSASLPRSPRRGRRTVVSSSS